MGLFDVQTFVALWSPGAPTSSITSFAGDEIEAESDFCKGTGK